MWIFPIYTTPDQKKTSSFSLTLTMPIASWYTGRTTCILAQQKRQISKAGTQGWRQPAFTKRKSRNNLMSRSSLNNLRESNASRMLPCGLYVWVL